MLNDLLQSLNDPHARHAMMVHLPIAGSLLGLLLTFIWALTRFRSTGLGSAAAVLFLCGSLGAALAARAGEAAADGVEGTALSAAEKQALESHEELGENGWIWPLIPAALIGLGLIARTPEPKQVNRIRVAMGVLGLVGGVGVAGWVATTAHEGGKLVYTHGLGVPARGAGPAAPGALPQGEPQRGSHDEDD